MSTMKVLLFFMIIEQLLGTFSIFKIFFNALINFSISAFKIRM